MALTAVAAFSSLAMLFYSPTQQLSADCSHSPREAELTRLQAENAELRANATKHLRPAPPEGPFDLKDRFYTGNFTRGWYEVAADRPEEVLGSGFRGRDVGLTPMHYARDIPGWDTREVSKMIVMARNKEDITWLDTYLKGVVPHLVYTVEDAQAANQVPKNSGNEAMIFLTYIIDHYDDLPDSVAFIHGHRSAWHQFRGLDKDVLLNNLKWGRFHYANLRCDQITVGHMCPQRPELSMGWMQDETRRYASMWDKLFLADLGPMPPFVDDVCCAEFMVSRDAIRLRTKQFYEKCRNWLMETDWHSANSGRIFEHAWHMIFGMPPRFGNPRDCPKSLYGL